MPIAIRCFEASLIPDVARAYNERTERAPYCFPMTCAMWGELLGRHKDFDPGGLRLAYRDGRPVGIIHAEAGDADGCIGAILLFLAGDQETAEALLNSALDYLGRFSVHTCHAVSHQSGSRRYYGGVHMGYDVGLWTGFHYVVAAFRHYPFDLAGTTFVMSRGPASTAETIPPTPPGIELAIAKVDGSGSFCSTYSVIAVADDEEIGACDFHVLHTLSRHMGHGIGQLSVGVDPTHRGRGIGTALLCRAHRELKQRGMVQSILVTSEECAPAIRLYERLGYRREAIDMAVFSGSVRRGRRSDGDDLSSPRAAGPAERQCRSRNPRPKPRRGGWRQEGSTGPPAARLKNTGHSRKRADAPRAWPGWAGHADCAGAARKGIYAP